MSAINLGNQSITFDFKHPNTAAEFNTLLKDGLKPGVYSGGTIAFADNYVSIAPFVIYILSSTGNLLRIETTDTVVFSVDPSTPILSLTYTRVDTPNTWLDWNQRGVLSSPLTNEVCLGRCIFTSTGITSISYTNKTWGKQYTSDVATGQAPLVITSTTKVDNLNVDKLDGADLSTDASFSANSDVLIPSQKATKSYIDSSLDISTQLSPLNSRISNNEEAISELTIEVAYLSGRDPRRKGVFIEAFINREYDGTVENSGTTVAEIMCDTDWNNNWKYFVDD